MMSYLAKPSKIFLLIYITCYLYSDTLLCSYLSVETNGAISRHVDQILSPQTWTSSHFSAFIITQPGLSKEWKSPKMSEFCFFWPPTGVNMGGRHVYRILKVAQWWDLAPPTISWKYLSNSRRNPKKLDTPPLAGGFWTGSLYLSGFYLVGFENGSTALTKRQRGSLRTHVYRNNGKCYDHNSFCIS